MQVLHNSLMADRKSSSYCPDNFVDIDFQGKRKPGYWKEIIANEKCQWKIGVLMGVHIGVHIGPIGVDIPTRNSRTVFFGTESIINLGAKLWNMVPVNIKSSESLNIVKSKTKYWTPNHSPCRNCKTYIGQVGFVN